MTTITSWNSSEFSQFVQDNADRLGLRRVGGQLQGPCPSCAGSNRFYRRDDTGGVFCRQCCPDGSDADAFKRLMAAAGYEPERRRSNGSAGAAKPSRREVERYPYTTADGREFHVVRYEPKDFRRDPVGVKGPFLLYGNPPAESDLPLILVESEKCVAAANSLGFRDHQFTTWCGGAGSFKSTDWKHYREREIVIVPDNDQAGQKSAKGLSAHLRELGIKSRTVDVSAWPEGGDLEQFAAGNSQVEVRAMLRPKPLIRPMGTEMGKIEWLIPGWLPCGMVTNCIAEGGSGKGVTQAKVMAAVTLGINPFTGEPTSAPAGVLILSEQDSRRYVQRPRLIAAGAVMDRVFTMDREALREPVRLAREIVGKGIRLVVLDQMVGGLAADRKSNSDVDVADHMKLFEGLAESTGAAFVVVLHTVKGGGAKLKDNTPLRDLARGSGAWVDVCRMNWMIFADLNCEEQSRLMVRVKCNLPVNWLMGGLRLFGHDVPVEGGEDATVIHNVEVVEGTNREIAQAALTRKPDEGVEELPKYRRVANTIWSLLPVDGPRLQSEIYAELKAEGIAVGTIDKAIKYLLSDAKRIGRQPATEFPELSEADQSAKAIYRTG